MQSEVLKSVLLPWSDQLVPSWVFYVLLKAVFPRAWEPCQGWTPGVPGTTTLTAGGLSCSPAPSLALDRLSVCLSRAGKLSQVSPFPGTHCSHPQQTGPLERRLPLDQDVLTLGQGGQYVWAASPGNGRTPTQLRPGHTGGRTGHGRVGTGWWGPVSWQRGQAAKTWRWPGVGPAQPGLQAPGVCSVVRLTSPLDPSRPPPPGLLPAKR